MMVFNTIFGGGVSSRLFQKVREELALVYSIYSSPSAYPGCGGLYGLFCGYPQEQLARHIADPRGSG